MRALFPFETTNSTPLVILVDVNGFKKPNKLGIDIFTAEMFGDRILPMGSQGSSVYDDNSYCAKVGGGWYNGMSCSDDVLLN